METKQVILVLMSYRLGPLGFLSTGDNVVSGNFGLKDQALAIKWVHRYIKYFGGDPKNLTCMGQSAGAASCHFQMINPEIGPLLGRVVLMSGSAIAPWSGIEKNPMSKAVQFATAVGVKNADNMTSEMLVEELRKKEAKELIVAHEKMKVNFCFF